MTKFILSFWAFRVKNNNHEYTIDVENRNLENDTNESNEKFSFSFKLIDDVFNKYLQKLLIMKQKYVLMYFKSLVIKRKILKMNVKNLLKIKKISQKK